MKTDTFLSTIPFGGFYNSIHSEEVDSAIEQMLSDSETGCDAAPDFILDVALQAIDYSAVYDEYSKAYADSFLEWLSLDGAFESMISPREYNFATDIVFVELSRNDLARLWRGIDKADLTKACRDRFTSYDGFISGYSSDWKTWGPLSTWDHNQLGTLIGVYAETEQGTSWDQWAEYSLIEDYSCNGCFDNWICDHATPDLTRALNAWDYLQERGRRAIKTIEQWHAARRAENRPFADTPLGGGAME